MRPFEKGKIPLKAGDWHSDSAWAYLNMLIRKIEKIEEKAKITIVWKLRDQKMRNSC
jgi:hypothetical protein